MILLRQSIKIKLSLHIAYRKKYVLTILSTYMICVCGHIMSSAFSPTDSLPDMCNNVA